MAINYDLNNTGPEVQARLDKVFPNEEAISQETANREEADENILAVAKDYTDHAAEHLTEEISSEVNRAQMAEDGLQFQIENEVGRALNKENALQSQVDTLGREKASKDEVEAGLDTKADAADVYTKSETYSKTELNNLITTPDQQFVTVEATAGTTAATDVLPDTGEADTVYRVGKWDGTQYDSDAYSEYAWDGTQYVLLSAKNPSIDAVPFSGSTALAESGGIAEIINYGSRGLFLDLNHYIAKAGDVYSYGSNTSWVCLWVPLRSNYKKITVTGIGFSTYRFFNSYTISAATFVEQNETGDVPDGAVVCCINSQKTSNPDGFGQLRVEITEDIDIVPTEGSVKPIASGAVYGLNDEIKANAVKIASLYPDRAFIDADHLCTFTGGGDFDGYNEDVAWDAVWITPQYGTAKVSFSGVVAGKKSYFSSLVPSAESYLGRNDDGTIIADTKLVVVNMSKASNPDGYGDMVVSQNGVVTADDIKGVQENTIHAAQGFIIDKDHYIHIVGTPQVYTYEPSDEWDSLWIFINDPNIMKVNIGGINVVTYRFFDTIDLSQVLTSHFLGQNTTGVVPTGAALCLISMRKISNPDGYDNARLTIETAGMTRKDIVNMFPGVIVQKNLINPNDLLVGYILNGTEWVARAGGVSSNKMYLTNGVSYAFQNILHYGNKHKICLCHFDENENFIGYTATVADYEEGSDIGRCVVRFSQAQFPTYSYSRVVLQTASSQNIDFTLCQVEVGDQYTEVVGYEEKLGFSVPESSNRKKVRLLAIGNSATQDAVAYVPFIMQNMGVDVDVQIGILMMSDSKLSDHVSNFINASAAYTLYLYDGGSSWQNLGLKSIQNALDDYVWDLVSFNQGANTDQYSFSNFQPYCNQIINLIGGYVGYPVKFVWYNNAARPATTNSGANWSDSDISNHYENSVSAAARLMDEALFEVEVPVGTAIQNARTIETLKLLGAYKDNPNNTSPWGYLTCYDGIHLQEGLPCQIAAYSFILALLDVYGFDEHSIIGETTRVTADWAASKAIPGPHGDYIGSDDTNCLIAQKCAVMAYKNPYMVTDMNYIVNPS